MKNFDSLPFVKGRLFKLKKDLTVPLFGNYGSSGRSKIFPSGWRTLKSETVGLFISHAKEYYELLFFNILYENEIYRANVYLKNFESYFEFLSD